MKRLSIPIILVTLSLSSCRSMRLADVLPETKGTAMGSVTIGKENIDYFVIPQVDEDNEPLPFEFNTFGADGAVTSASSVVVFKTRERHPVYRTMHGLGTPVRAFDHATANAFDKAVSMAHSLVNRPEAALSKESAESAEIPPPLLPAAEPQAQPAEPESVEVGLPTPEPFANSAITTADHTEPQANRNRG